MVFRKLLYSGVAVYFFYLGATEEPKKIEPVIKTDTVYVTIEKIIEKEVDDDIIIRGKRNNKVDEEFYFGVDLDKLKEKYVEVKEEIYKNIENIIRE
ncbi:hypothetical protein HQ529_02565 [Candidatus Woesearchaeota archaeon]|nr:hypothetical protein [Candidatus Woesearchaeota archaeon]